MTYVLKIKFYIIFYLMTETNFQCTVKWRLKVGMWKWEWTSIGGQRLANSAYCSNEYADKNQAVAPELAHVYTATVR
jgi:hypothetical protein